MQGRSDDGTQAGASINLGIVGTPSPADGDPFSFGGGRQSRAHGKFPPGLKASLEQPPKVHKSAGAMMEGEGTLADFIQQQSGPVAAHFATGRSSHEPHGRGHNNLNPMGHEHSSISPDRLSHASQVLPVVMESPRTTTGSSMGGDEGQVQELSEVAPLAERHEGLPRWSNMFAVRLLSPRMSRVSQPELPVHSPQHHHSEATSKQHSEPGGQQGEVT